MSIDSSHTQELRAKKITDRRKLFFTALKRVEKPSQFHVVDAQMIAFTSQKSWMRANAPPVRCVIVFALRRHSPRICVIQKSILTRSYVSNAISVMMFARVMQSVFQRRTISPSGLSPKSKILSPFRCGDAMSVMHYLARSEGKKFAAAVSLRKRKLWNYGD